MLTVRHRSIRVSNEKYMRKVRDCRAGWSSCEILALPCHSVSVVRFNVKKLFTKVWRIQWLTWWFKTLHSQKLRMVQIKVAWMQHAIQCQIFGQAGHIFNIFNSIMSFPCHYWLAFFVEAQEIKLNVRSSTEMHAFEILD